MSHARRTLWVTTTNAVSFWAFSVTRRWCISSDVRLSRLPVSSSAKTTSGFINEARAMATRCCSPPDSSRFMAKSFF